MVLHVSNYVISGDAFTSAGPDFTMVVDANIAFLISESGGNGATLTGSWNVIVNGEVAAFGVNYNGIGIVGGISVVTNITVGGSLRSGTRFVPSSR